jgi:biotin transporter BioY
MNRNPNMKPEESKWAIVDYCLNKFCPLLIIGFLVFAQFSVMDWRPYLIMGLILFIEKNNFKIGYSVAFCEERGLIKSDEQ